jgi:hypothetical protein
MPEMTPNKALERTGYAEADRTPLPVSMPWFQSRDRFRPVAQLDR